MFAEKSVIFNFCEILFQIKDDLYKKFDDGVPKGGCYVINI